jgi:hypothetical protein
MCHTGHYIYIGGGVGCGVKKCFQDLRPTAKTVIKCQNVTCATVVTAGLTGPRTSRVIQGTGQFGHFYVALTVGTFLHTFVLQFEKISLQYSNPKSLDELLERIQRYWR